jgi:hypothetical protein
VEFKSQEIADKVLKAQLLSSPGSLQQVSGDSDDVVILKLEGSGIHEIRITRLDNNIKSVLFTANLKTTVNENSLKFELEKIFPNHIKNVEFTESKTKLISALIYCHDKIKAKTVLLKYKMEPNLAKLYNDRKIHVAYSNKDEKSRKDKKQSQPGRINQQLPPYNPYQNEAIMVGGPQGVPAQMGPGFLPQQNDMGYMPMQYPPQPIMIQPGYEGYMQPNMAMVQYPPVNQNPNNLMGNPPQQMVSPYGNPNQININRQFPPQNQQPVQMVQQQQQNQQYQPIQQQFQQQQHQNRSNQNAAYGGFPPQQGMQPNQGAFPPNQHQGGFGGQRGQNFDNRSGNPNQGAFNNMGPGGMNQHARKGPSGPRDPNMSQGGRKGFGGSMQNPANIQQGHQQQQPPRNYSGSVNRGVRKNNNLG